MDDTKRRHAPATLRNRDAILAALKRHLPARGAVLEVASGTGEHAAHFAAALPLLAFRPSDPDPGARASIDAWAADARLPNLRAALALDVSAPDWERAAGEADAVLCINMVHIAPWAATVGLMRGAARLLPAGGVLCLYGPFRREGRHTASSNAAFDADLRASDPAWGVRDLEAVVAEAVAWGFVAPMVEEMPANNLFVAFRRKCRFHRLPAPGRPLSTRKRCPANRAASGKAAPSHLEEGSHRRRAPRSTDPG